MNIIRTVIVTDSTCDMRKEVSLMLDVEVVPLTVTFGNTTYNDGFGGIMKKLFYARMRAGTISPITSQPSPEKFLSVFNRHKELGDEVIYIGISSRSSGTLQAARIARNMCDYEHIHIVDSYNLSQGLEVLVRTACRMRDHGKKAVEIVEKLNVLIPKVKSISVVQSLNSLVRGGRVQQTGPFADGRLGMKNMIAFMNGVFTPVGTERGMRGAFERIYRTMAAKEINDELPVILTHADSKEHMYWLEKFLRSKGMNFEYIHSEIGGVIGTHMGPGTVGVAFVEK